MTDELPAVLGFGGVMLTLLFNGWLSRQQDRWQLDDKRKALRIALAEELKVSLNSYKDAIEKIEAAELDQTISISVPTKCFTFVYEQMIDQIGLLTASEVEAAMNAYLMVQQMPQTIRKLPGTKVPSPDWLDVADTQFGNLRRLMQNMVQIVEGAIRVLSKAKRCSIEPRRNPNS
jgi:hypothetical protein